MATDSQLREWAHCRNRFPYLANSLRHRIGSFRRMAEDARKAFSQDFMGEPSCYLAEGYDACADLLQEKLDRLTEAKEERRL